MSPSLHNYYMIVVNHRIVQGVYKECGLIVYRLSKMSLSDMGRILLVNRKELLRTGVVVSHAESFDDVNLGDVWE